MSSSQKKILVFGLLGMAGCLAGWLIGEGWLKLALAREESGTGRAPSLAARPEAPKIDRLSSYTPPRPEALPISDRAAPPPSAAVPTVARPVPPPLPAEFADRLKAAGGKSGQLQFTLLWFNRNDLDLHCIDPNGEEIYFGDKRAKKSGGHLDVDRNVNGETGEPIENIYYPEEHTPPGRYRIYVNHFARKVQRDPTDYKVNILIEGERHEFTGKISHGERRHLVHEFVFSGLQIGAPPEVVVYPGSSNRFRIRIARMGDTSPVFLTFSGHTDGLTLPKKLVVIPEESEVEGTVQAEEKISGDRQIKVVAEGKYGTVSTEFRVVVREPDPVLRISVPSEVVVYAGGTNRFQALLSRLGNVGPVRLTFSGETEGLGLPSEVTATTDQGMAEVCVAADRKAPAGTRQIRVAAKGTNGQDEAKYTVTVLLPDPVVLLAAPPNLDVQAGGRALVPVRVARDSCEGPIEIRPLRMPSGLSMMSVTIPAGKDEADLELKAAEVAAPGELNLEAVADMARSTSATAVVVTPPPSRWSWRLILVIAVWTSLLSIGLAILLSVGQNYYLARPLMSPKQMMIALVGGGAAGLIAGGVGQALFSLSAQVGMQPELGFIAGWLLLGGLLGRGLGFFIPNLHPWHACLAGMLGGLLGAVAFILLSQTDDTAGRLAGAACVGFCVGLMVALVEATFRSAWLEVRLGPRELVTVNLGPEPVRVGGDARRCTVWAKGAVPIALRYWIKDGKVLCGDGEAGGGADVAAGARRTVGTVEVTVRTGASSSAPTATAPRPAAPQPIASPPIGPDPFDDLPVAAALKPVAVAPSPVSTPAVRAPGAAPPLPAGAARASAPPLPSAPGRPTVSAPPLPTGASRPPIPARATPPVVAPQPPRPAPPAPAASGPAPTAADGTPCPQCKRKVMGRPGHRYCVTCDVTF